MHCKSYSHFFSKKFQNICVSFDVNFNESLTNGIVSFEQLGPDFHIRPHLSIYNLVLASDIVCKKSRPDRLIIEVNIEDKFYYFLHQNIHDLVGYSLELAIPVSTHKIWKI